MMYEAFFGLRIKPFDLLPDPEFLYLGKSHRKALTVLDYALEDRAGFILLTGEIGAGKTTVIRGLMDKHRDRTVMSRLFNTRVTSEQLLAMINEDFGLPVRHLEKTELLLDLNRFLIEQYAAGTRPLLIIDEAQNLSADALEEVRLLSNLETGDAKLLQIILVGQPELSTTLALPALTQLRQRINFFCHMRPLDRDEVPEYIAHRLAVAGNRDAVRFSPEALELICRFSRGIPRLINIICDYLLLAAFSDETRDISGTLTEEVIAELDFERRFWGEESTAGDSEPQSAFRMEDPSGDAVFMSEIRTAVSEIAVRLKRIEETNRESCLQDILLLGKRIERLEANLEEFHRNFEQEIKLYRDKLFSENSPDKKVAPGIAPADERKRGFLGKLFRTS